MPCARIRVLPAAAFIAVVAAAQFAGVPAHAADAVMPGNAVVVSHGLVGVGRLPAALRDRFGETFGSGSGMAFDPASWVRTPDGYRGTLYLQPDRGYNVIGTTDYQPRINKLAIELRPVGDPAALPPDERQRTVRATLVDSIMLTDAAGEPLTSLDPIAGGIRPAAGGFPPMSIPSPK